MISVLMMAINAIASILVSVLKAFFSMLTWFLRSCAKVLKLFFCILPITCISFFLLLCANIFLLFGGNFGLLSFGYHEGTQFQIPHSLDVPNANIDIPNDVFQEANESFQKNNYVVTNMFNDLKHWWIESVYSYKGSPLYIFLLILTILMFIPVVTILLSISVFLSFSKILFFCIIADMVVYVLRAIIGKGFVSQTLDRYYFLFPDAGKRHYEKNYEKWLKNRSYEDDDNYHRKRKDSSFYDDNDEFDGYDDEYDEEDYYEDEEEYFEEDDEYYEDDGDYNEDYDEDYDENYDEDYANDYEEDDYEDDRFEKKHNSSSSQNHSEKEASTVSKSTFDFFAGCTSRESVDKKYRSLVKLYHPDNMDGDTAALQEINVQYDQAKKRFS